MWGGHQINAGLGHDDMVSSISQGMKNKVIVTSLSLLLLTVDMAYNVH